MVGEEELKRISFAKPLVQARIVNRPNRFIVIADLDGKQVRCHSAVPGSIGGLVLDGLPCLLSGPHEGARTTEYSLEAFAVREPHEADFQWIGVNQTAANSYVEHAPKAGWLSPMASPENIKREKRLGRSRIDFLLDESTYLEVKMPIDNLQLDLPPSIPRKFPIASKGISRAGLQAIDLTGALEGGARAILLTCFAYDNDGRWREWPYKRPVSNPDMTLDPKKFPGAVAMANAAAAGMERWQVSFKFEPTHLEFLRLVKVS